LLVALSVAAGDLPPLPAGAIHGVEPGSYLSALCAAPLLALGLGPVLAGKLVALLFGSATAAVCAGWTAVLVRSAHGSRTAHAAALLVAVAFAVSWPGLHFEHAGMSGRSPESLLFQLLAVALLISGRSTRPRLAALLCGTSLGLAWLFSPVALWTLLLVGLLLFVPAPLYGAPSFGRGRFAALVLVGLALPFVVLGLLLPEGWWGLKLFFVQNLGFDGLGVASGLVREGGDLSGVQRPGPLYLLARLWGAFEGGAHNEQLSVRAYSLGVLAWAAGASLLWTLLKARSQQQRAFRALAAISLSWVLPLSFLPLDRGFYPLAYRYWGLPLAVALMLLAAFVVAPAPATVRLKRSLFVALLVTSLLPLPTLGRSIVAPSSSLAVAVVGTGAHGMAPRQGRQRHYAFIHLRKHAPEAVDRYLSEGYGLALGADAAVSSTRGDLPQPTWQLIRDELPPQSWRALQIGIGCGAASFPSQSGPLRQALVAGSDRDDADIAYGFERCAQDEARQLLAELPAATAPQEIDFSVPDPRELLPDRF